MAEPSAITYRELGADDLGRVLRAGELFDGPPQTEATQRFLTLPGHHMVFAEDVSGRAVGFVSGVETTHPDKGTEMFLYELGVAEDARRRGIGRALVLQLRDIARRQGCYGMWTAVEPDHDVALACYLSAGAQQEPAATIVLWDGLSD